MMPTLHGTGPLIVVDNNDLDTEILRRCFDRSTLAETYRFLPFGNGEAFLAHMELVETSQEPLPSIVILDINMPILNGFQILDALRSNQNFASLPSVAFLSSSDRAEDKNRAAAYGATFSEKFAMVRDGVDFFNACSISDA